MEEAEKRAAGSAAGKQPSRAGRKPARKIKPSERRKREGEKLVRHVLGGLFLRGGDPLRLANADRLRLKENRRSKIIKRIKEQGASMDYHLKLVREAYAETLQLRAAAKELLSRLRSSNIVRGVRSPEAKAYLPKWADVLTQFEPGEWGSVDEIGIRLGMDRAVVRRAAQYGELNGWLELAHVKDGGEQRYLGDERVEAMMTEIGKRIVVARKHRLLARLTPAGEWRREMYGLLS